LSLYKPNRKTYKSLILTIKLSWYLKKIFFFRFQLQLYTKDPLPFDHNNAYLNVIEINPFKHLCHLQLTFMPGNDSDVKKYLATCLQGLRENYIKLNKEYDDNKMNLSQRLENTQQVSFF
jgi:spindle assembly abnormal protein 6